MYTVEWQKRGLPHIHLLLWLTNKLRSDQIDNVITAEIPNKDKEPVLYDTVARHMIHGPCGALNLNSPCINNGKCWKNFQRHFRVKRILVMTATQNTDDDCLMKVGLRLLPVIAKSTID